MTAMNALMLDDAMCPDYQRLARCGPKRPMNWYLHVAQPGRRFGGLVLGGEDKGAFTDRGKPVAKSNVMADEYLLRGGSSPVTDVIEGGRNGQRACLF